MVQVHLKDDGYWENEGRSNRYMQMLGVFSRTGVVFGVSKFGSVFAYGLLRCASPSESRLDYGEHIA